MNKKYYLPLICLIFSLSGQAYASSDLSLEKAVSKALKNNFQVKILKRKEDAARLNDTWGAAGRYPTITAGLILQNYNSEAPVENTDTRMTTRIDSITPSVSLNWKLFNGFAVSITKRKLALLNRVSEGNSALTVENTIQAVILAYYNARLQQEQLKISREVRALSEDRYEYVKMKKELGSAGTYDELQARIAFLDDTARCHSRMLSYHSVLRSLNQVMGESGKMDYTLTTEFTHEAREYEYSDLVRKMTKSNRTLKNQYFNRELMKNEIGLNRSQLYPSISLNSGVNLERYGVKVGAIPRVYSNTLNYYVGFTLGVTLSDGGRIRRAIANARINHRIAELQTGELELSLKNQLINLLEMYNIHRQLLEVAEEKMASARLSLQISGEKFRSGAINSFNYRDSQLVYLNSAFEKLSAVYNLIESHTDLVRITGGIISEE